MAIKVLKHTKSKYSHMDLLDIANHLLSPDAIKLKAAAIAWTKGEFFLDEFIEAIAEKFFTGEKNTDFEGDEYENWDPSDYVYDEWEGMGHGGYGQHEKFHGYIDELETTVLHVDYRPSEKTEDLTTEKEMETV